MNILFISPSNSEFYPLQIGALSAFLKRHNHNVALLPLVVPKTLNKWHFKEIEHKMDDFRPHLVAFSVYEMSFPWVRKIAAFIKDKYGTKTIAGGYYPTLAPEEVISDNYIDIVCRGEGEHALLELLNSMSKGTCETDILNLWVKKDGKIYKNNIRPLIENLDILPYPDREMFDYQKHLNLSTEGDRDVKVMASRGCPYRCTYCSNLYFKELYPNKNKYLRMRTVDRLIEELIYLKNNFSFNYVGFHDDNLTLFPEWLKEFTEKYRKKINIPFYCAARAETCSDENLDYLKKAGCFMVLIGIECGDEKYRDTMMNRKMSNKLILDVCRRIKEREMFLWTFNMVGMPGETRKHLLKTILLNWRIGPDFAMTSLFYPFKGTEMGELCYKEKIVNLKKKEIIGSYANHSILNHPNIAILEIRIAKYLTILSAIRSRFFYRQFLKRIRNIFKG